MKRNKRPSCWTISSTASRVVPGMGETIARSVPVSWLSSVDLPTLGWPMMATLISWLSALGSRPSATELLVLGSRLLVIGSWLSALGSWLLVRIELEFAPLFSRFLREGGDLDRKSVV